MGVHGCAWVCMGVHGCVKMKMWTFLAKNVEPGVRLWDREGAATGGGVEEGGEGGT